MNPMTINRPIHMRKTLTKEQVLHNIVREQEETVIMSDVTVSQVATILTKSATDFLGVSFPLVEYVAKLSILIAALIFSTLIYFVIIAICDFLGFSYILGSFLLLVAWIFVGIVVVIVIMNMVQWEAIRRHKNEVNSLNNATPHPIKHNYTTDNLTLDKELKNLSHDFLVHADLGLRSFQWKQKQNNIPTGTGYAYHPLR